MKAICIREPDASMIFNGEKTIETRTWCTNYRGRLLLTASKLPKGPLSGKAFAIADLVACRPMHAEDVPKAGCDLEPGRTSWVLNDIRKIDPFPVLGRLGLFEVDFDG